MRLIVGNNFSPACSFLHAAAYAAAPWRRLLLANKEPADLSQAPACVARLSSTGDAEECARVTAAAGVRAANKTERILGY